MLEFGETIERDLLERVSALDRHVRAHHGAGRLTGLLETVPTFRSLALVFDPLETTPAALLEALAGPTPETAPDSGTAPREWSLPVRYGGEHGPDLAELASSAGISEEALIERHESVPLAVYMLGFQPGFAFLGDIDPLLRRPRRETPRLRVPAGSVAVANALSAVYPWESPGGWHLIGHSPVPLFDAAREVPALLRAADTVRFRRVDADEHAALSKAVASGALDPATFRER